MNRLPRILVFFALALASMGAVNVAFADSVVNVFVPQVKISNVTSASASGICNPSGGAITADFHDGSAHSVVASPTCTVGGTWSTNVDLTTLNDGTNHVDVTQGANSDLNKAFSKDTVAPFLNGIFVYNGTFDTNFDANFDGTQSTLANGYTFSTTTPPFELTSSDSLNTVDCYVDSGSSSDCSSFFYRPPSALANGSHTLHINLTDSAGNSAATSSAFCVNSCGGDTTPPVIAQHATTTAEAMGPSGASVTFTVTATDNVDSSVTVNCSPASGAVFALGTTTVTCTAHDTALNYATSTFPVVVRDTTAPVISAVSDVSASLTGEMTSVTVNYSTPSVSDVVSTSLTASCSPLSGTAFSVGNTTVTCNVTDGAQNQALAVTFTIRVADNRPAQGNGPPVPNPPAFSGAIATAPIQSGSAPTTPSGATPVEVTQTFEPVTQERVASSVPETVAKFPASSDAPASEQQDVVPASQTASAGSSSYDFRYIIMGVLLVLMAGGLLVWSPYWSRIFK